MHGDASFAGQGVVYEVLQMSQLRGYRTGGTIHIVVNNQVGFTTAPHESRTSLYSTDVAKTVQSPVIHVNGDDPDACVRAARIAFEFREQFHRDVVVDLVCYRRRGHNEGDDPSFTQPHMYDLIEQKRSTRRLYTEQLIGRGDISTQDADEAMSRFRSRLEELFAAAHGTRAAEDDEDYSRTPYYPTKPAAAMGTNITAETMQLIADAYVRLPDSFTPHPKVMPQLERRAKAIMNGPIDWATGRAPRVRLAAARRPPGTPERPGHRGAARSASASPPSSTGVTNDEYVPLKHLAVTRRRSTSTTRCSASTR